MKKNQIIRKNSTEESPPAGRVTDETDYFRLADHPSRISFGPTKRRQAFLALNFAGLNAGKMLFWSAAINGLPAPRLILFVILLTSSHKVMGKRVNSPLLRYLGWATLGVMTAAAVGMIITS